MTDTVRTYSLLGIRWGLSLVFGVSGVGKLIDGRGAIHLVELIFEGVLPITGWPATVVMLVSVAEILLATILATGWKLTWVLALSFGMISGFTVALLSLLGGGDVASCGCFGAFGFGLSLEATILRNLVLLALILGGILLSDMGIGDGTRTAGVHSNTSRTR